jgi:UDP-glucose 4-epimerase
MSNISDARCVVLGAGGFIGTNLCRHLRQRVHTMRAFGRSKPHPDALDGVDWHQGDFTDPAAYASALEGCTTVVHLISATNPASANADMVADIEANVVSCRLSGVRKIVYVSSGGTIYGITSQIPTPESAPLNPITAYGVSKLSIERYIALHHHLYGIEYSILRVANPYGPFQMATKGQGAIAAFLQKIMSGEDIEIWGDGNVIRDFIYVDDVVEAIAAAITHAHPVSVFNIGSGRGHSINEIIDAIQCLMGRPVTVRRQSGRLIDVPRSILDISLAKTDMHWVPHTSLESGLAQTLTWLQARPERPHSD